MRRIEVSFALPVEMTDDEMHRLHDLIDGVARRHQPEGMVHWLSGCGSKPRWSQADAAFLGRTTAPDAPASGEPTFDDDVLFFETFAREAHPSERSAPRLEETPAHE